MIFYNFGNLFMRNAYKRPEICRKKVILFPPLSTKEKIGQRYNIHRLVQKKEDAVWNLYRGPGLWARKREK